MTRSYSRAPKLFFAYGIGNSFSFPLYTGCTAILLEDRPTAENTLDMIERFKPTLDFGVPTLYAAQVAALGSGRTIEMKQARMCLSGGEPLPPAVMERWNWLTGVPVLDGIGSSEGLHIYAQNLPGAIQRPDRPARPFPGYRLRVIDTEGAEAPDGQPGELVVQGESFAKFYWNKPEKTATAWTRDGWFRSGDTMYRDEDGYFFFCGRGDDMLKVGGIWVAPFEVEFGARGTPGRDRSGRDRRARRKRADQAEGILRPTRSGKAGPAMAEELIRFTKQKLAPYKYPRWVEFLDELPKTASGKISALQAARLTITRRIDSRK